MSTPIIESIAEDIRTTLASVTAANGYNQDLSPTRPRRIDYLNAAWGDLSVIVSQTEADRGADTTLARDWQQNFMAIAFVIDSDDEENPVDTRKNQVAGDIIKALMVDSTRGGYAIDTDVTKIMMFDDDEGGPGGVALTIQVHYRTDYNDPYIQA